MLKRSKGNVLGRLDKVPKYDKHVTFHVVLLLMECKGSGRLPIPFACGFGTEIRYESPAYFSGWGVGSIG